MTFKLFESLVMKLNIRLYLINIASNAWEIKLIWEDHKYKSKLSNIKTIIKFLKARRSKITKFSNQRLQLKIIKQRRTKYKLPSYYLSDIEANNKQKMQINWFLVSSKRKKGKKGKITSERYPHERDDEAWIRNIERVKFDSWRA